MNTPNKHYIYTHEFLDNNQWILFYVGRGSTPNYKRAKEKHHGQSHWLEAIKDKQWRYNIIKDNLNLKDAINEERNLIKHYGLILDKTGILINRTLLQTDYKEAIQFQEEYLEYYKNYIQEWINSDTYQRFKKEKKSGKRYNIRLKNKLNKAVSDNLIKSFTIYDWDQDEWIVQLNDGKMGKVSYWGGGWECIYLSHSNEKNQFIVNEWMVQYSDWERLIEKILSL